MELKLNLPLDREAVRELKAGQRVLLSGIIYTARDAAHKRLIADYEQGICPIVLENSAMYYAGPTPKKEGQVIGSCGPTTSGRMDLYTPWFIEKGQTVMVGKGLRNEAVIDAMEDYGAVYLTAVGGAGALLSKCIVEAEVVAYDDLGTEAIQKLKIKDFPTIVTIDTKRKNLYDIEKNRYRG